MSVYFDVHGVKTTFNSQSSDNKTSFHHSPPFVLCCSCVSVQFVSVHVVCFDLTCVRYVLSAVFACCLKDTFLCFLCSVTLSLEMCFIGVSFVYTAMPVLSTSHADLTRSIWDHASPTLCSICVSACSTQSLCGYCPRQCSGITRSFETASLDLSDLTFFFLTDLVHQISSKLHVILSFNFL